MEITEKKGRGKGDRGWNIISGKCGFQKAYTDPQELAKKADEYFDVTPGDKVTRAGLALYLGISKPTLLVYEKRDDAIGEVVKKAMTRIEEGLELDLKNSKVPTGTIFALKNVAGWRDNQDVEVKGGGFEIVCNVPRPEEK